MHRSTQAIAENDQGALAAEAGNFAEARWRFAAALRLDADCQAARLNRVFLDAIWPEEEQESISPPIAAAEADHKKRVAVLSFLFNWPSRGGGIYHTVEMARSLERAGYVVRHIHARIDAWGVGQVAGPPPIPSEVIELAPAQWSVEEVERRYRRAVEEFDPDVVFLCDAWNTKPILARAVRGYPTVWVLQALECLCPLNNVRLLPAPDWRSAQCGRNQLATPRHCRECLQKNVLASGPLHRLERGFAGVGSEEYDRLLRESLAESAAVLVMNPLVEAMVSPFAPRVEVVPAAIDAERFNSLPIDVPLVSLPLNHSSDLPFGQTDQPSGLGLGSDAIENELGQMEPIAFALGHGNPVFHGTSSCLPRGP